MNLTDNNLLHYDNGIYKIKLKQNKHSLRGKYNKLIQNLGKWWYEYDVDYSVIGTTEITILKKAKK